MIFENCEIQAPDGQKLGYCSKKKKKWYLKNNLVDQINEQTIRLKFEPKGREGINDPLALKAKENRCVVCGSRKDLTRHHIVPYSFIKHMNVSQKVEAMHDIFALCEPCHVKYEKASNQRREEMIEQLGISVFGLETKTYQEVIQAIKSAHTLTTYGEKIPESKRKDLMNYVTNFLGRKPNQTDLQEMSQYKICNHPDYIRPSQRIVESVNDIEEFARLWRVHFVETMNPRYMPKEWTTDRGLKAKWIPSRFNQ